MDRLQFLAEVITDRTSNESVENNVDCGGGCDAILTQPPEVIANAEAEDSAAMNHDSVTSGAADPSANDAKQPSKRKSKLKKSNRQSSKSVLETMSSESMTSATAAAVALQTKPAAPSKTANNSNNAATATDTASRRAKKSPPKKKKKAVNPPKLLKQITVGARLEVYWPDDDKYYRGVVMAYCPAISLRGGRKKAKGHVYTVHYEDGDMENVDLAMEKFRFVEDNAKSSSSPKNKAVAATQPSSLVTAVSTFRTELDELRQTTTNNPKDKLSCKKILQVLRKLDHSSDIDFYVLYHTGIGKTVNKLGRHSDAKISEAATPLLMKWRMIDESTPDEVKKSVQNEAAAMANNSLSSGAEMEDEDDCGARRSPRTKAAKAPYSPTVASAADNSFVDLTSSPPPSKVQNSDAYPKQENHPSNYSERQKANTATVVAAVARVTPASVRNNNAVNGGEGGKKVKKDPLPPPPDLAPSSSFKQNTGADEQSAKTKLKSQGTSKKTAARVSLSPAKAPPASTKQLPAHSEESAKPAKKKLKSHETSTSVAAGPDKPVPASAKQKSNDKHSAKSNTKSTSNVKAVAKPVSATAKPSNTKQTSSAAAAHTGSAKQPKSTAKSPSTSTAVGPATKAVMNSTSNPKQPPKKKNRTFHDQILYTMLTSCKPYTLKSLAKDTDTTVAGLNHAMLSFLDKKLVICKEFPSKKGSTREPKKLYWANPMSLSEVENAGGSGKAKAGGGAVVKELSKLLSTSQEVNAARQERGQLERQIRALQDELTPLLAIPTMQELDSQILAEEQKLKTVQDEIQAVQDRMANAAKAAVAPPSRPAGYNPYNRFAKPPPTKPQSPTTLKRKINNMLGEYKARKRKCMDFVEEVSEAMEKKTKDVLGDKVLALDTDEMEWGYYEDGSTGKVYGNPKPKKQFGLVRRRPLGGKKEEDTVKIVKIPARYKDV